MNNAWSENSSHILSLFRPATDQDRVSEGDILAAESNLGVELPRVLRQFQRDLGNHSELCRSNQDLLTPSEMWWNLDELVICTENQGVGFWQIPRVVLDQDDPPVHFCYNEVGAAPIHSHGSLSDFLDYLTYGHALAGGGLHGGYPESVMQFSSILEERHDWHHVDLRSYPAMMRPEAGYSVWPLIAGDGYLVDCFVACVVARSSKLLEELRSSLGVTWSQVW